MYMYINTIATTDNETDLGKSGTRRESSLKFTLFVACPLLVEMGNGEYIHTAALFPMLATEGHTAGVPGTSTALTGKATYCKREW